jgi:signal transduction histidine kinase
MESGGAGAMKIWSWKYLEKLKSLLRETAPPPEEMARRLQAVERDTILPVKAVFVGILLYYLYFSRWFEDPAIPRSVAQATVERFFLIYLVLNLLVAGLLIFSRQLPSPFMQEVIFSNSFVDGLFLAALAFVTGGFDSILYWVFLGLIVRNALSVPRAVPQIILNVSISVCYLAAGLLDLGIENEDLDMPGEAAAMRNPTEPFLLRLILLWLMTACCYGVQVLFEKQRQGAEEAQEASIRQGQLRSAGRLAAQIAHQLKNPLGVINNAAFSLERACGEGKKLNPQQLQIIREEVERSDRILTKLMGYAQLAEGHVEKLNPGEALDQAIAEVFPPGNLFPAEVKRDYAPNLPHLLMQRGHLLEILVNILQNAREATEGRGRIQVSAQPGPDHSVVISIADNGPGIAPEHQVKIFTPYFTTKEKGTGLGLAIVKNNVELYSGVVRVESELGKGARFVVEFPTRMIMKER